MGEQGDPQRLTALVSPTTLHERAQYHTPKPETVEESTRKWGGGRWVLGRTLATMTPFVKDENRMASSFSDYLCSSFCKREIK